MFFKEFFMAVSNYLSVTGIVQSVSNQSDNCCNPGNQWLLVYYSATTRRIYGNWSKNNG